MELLYIWIENFKNIKKQGFNFSSKYWFKFDYKKNELICKKNENYLPKDFFGDNIKNITAIVGENGSGKTSLIEFIHNGYYAFHETNFVVIIEKEKELLLQHTFNDVKADNNTCQNYFQIGIKFGEQKIRVEWIAPKRNPFFWFESVLYSSNFNPINNTISYDRFKDVSNSSIFSGNNRGDDINANTFDLIKQINLLKNKNFKLPFKIPENLIIHFDSYNHSDLVSYCKENNIKQKITISTEFHRINEFCEAFTRETIIRTISHGLEKGIKVEKDLFELKKPLKILEVFLKDKIEFFEEITKNIEQFTILALKLEKEKVINVASYRIFVKRDNLDKFLDLIQIYVEILKLTNRNVLGFKWSYENHISRNAVLSSGEFAFLSPFSRLNYEFTEFTEFTHDFFLILLDEFDLYLHPQWQKKVLIFLNKFLIENYSDKHFQIIITTHSPFICSDLPKQNIIFLDKDSETGLCKVSELKEHKQTFAANIHTLLTDSFFLKDGLIGEFAKEKIMEILDFIKNEGKKTEKIKSKEDCLKIIEIIGEPMIRNKLMQMFHEQFPEYENICRIKQLESEIFEKKSEIKKLKKNEKKNNSV